LDHLSSLELWVSADLVPFSLGSPKRVAFDEPPRRRALGIKQSTSALLPPDLTLEPFNPLSLGFYTRRSISTLKLQPEKQLIALNWRPVAAEFLPLHRQCWAITRLPCQRAIPKPAMLSIDLQTLTLPLHTHQRLMTMTDRTRLLHILPRRLLP
jgi:hypothetical protein